MNINALFLLYLNGKPPSYYQSTYYQSTYYKLTYNKSTQSCFSVGFIFVDTEIDMWRDNSIVLRSDVRYITTGPEYHLYQIILTL